MDDLSEILDEIAEDLNDPAAKLPPARVYIDRHGVCVQIRTRLAANKVGSEQERLTTANKGT